MRRSRRPRRGGRRAGEAAAAEEAAPACQAAAQGKRKEQGAAGRGLRRRTGGEEASRSPRRGGGHARPPGRRAREREGAGASWRMERTRQADGSTRRRPRIDARPRPASSRPASPRPADPRRRSSRPPWASIARAPGAQRGDGRRGRRRPRLWRGWGGAEEGSAATAARLAPRTRLASRREVRHFYLSSLLAKHTASPFASSVGRRISHAQCSA